MHACMAFIFVLMNIPKLKKILANKYIIATVIFIGFMIFGDKNNLIEQYELHKQYTKVKTEHDYYIRQIEKAKKDYNELFTNDRNLEKFAREKYLMKRDDEDVFVIVKTGPSVKTEVQQEFVDTAEE
jgi:cell division protein FtsB